MADAPNPITEPVAPPATPQPQAKDPAPQSRASDTPGIDPNQVLAVEYGGQTHHMTAAELVERAFKTGPQIDPEKLSKLETYEKAMAGDAEATRKLVESYLPKEPPKPADPAQLMASLQQEVQELRSAVGQVRPTVEQIEHLRHRSLIANTIDQQKDKLPLLAQDPEGADSVLYYFKQQAKAMQMKDNDPRLTGLLANALVVHENKLKSIVERYGGKVPGAAPTGTNGAAKVVDDQHRTAQTSIPAGLMIVNGRIVNERGQEFIQGPDRQFREISPSVPSTLPTGSTVPAGMPAPPKGPMTRNQMDQFNRDRLAALTQG